MLEDIEIFCAIVKAQNLSKAARHLHISPSIVTRRLARLEKQLGVRLLQRTTRRVMLTDAGQRYYGAVQDVLHTLKMANQEASSFTRTVTGTLKIGLPVSISHRYVSQHLYQLLKQFPHLKVHIVNGNHLLDLLDNDFDVILYCGSLPNISFHYKKIGVWRKIVCAAPGYLETYGLPQNPDDLARHNCLDHADNFQYSWVLQEIGNVKTIAVNGNVRVNSSIDLCNLAVSGLGIVYLPSFSIHDELQSGKLVAILEQYQLPVLDMYCVYPSKRYLSQKTQVFLDFLTNLLTPILGAH